MKRERVDVAYYTNVMRGIYALDPGVFTMKFVLFAIHEAWNQAAEIMLSIETEKAPSQWKHLRGWMNEMERFSKRLQMYYSAVLDPEFFESHVVQPVLHGHFPPDMRTEALEPTWTKTDDGYVGRPDVTQIAMLYNQAIVALSAFEDLWSDWILAPLGTRIAEGLMGAKRQAFEEAAPGEAPTARDEVEKKIDEVIEDTKRMVRGGAEAAAMIATFVLVAAGLALVAMVSKD
jgi:hypothetical protein